MSLKSVKVFAPATVANVTCGFDILGFAIDNPGDEVVVRLIQENLDKPVVTIKEITGDDGVLPYDPLKNTASVVILKMLSTYNINAHIEISVHKKMPLGSGLGSSAASSAASVIAVNELLNLQIPRSDLVIFAMEGERTASGSAHADNVAPSILGGFTLIRSYDPLDIIKIKTPDDLYAAVVHPHVEVNTRDARSVVRQTVELKKAIQQWGNVGGLILGLTTNDYALISRSMQDVIVEPARSILLPGFNNVKKAALDNHAIGCGISGSGPSIFALCRGEECANNVAQSMLNEFNKINIDGEVFVSKVNHEGCKILAI